MKYQSRYKGKTGGGIVKAATVGYAGSTGIKYVWMGNSHHLWLSVDGNLIIESGSDGKLSIPLSDRGRKRMMELLSHTF